MRTMADLNQLHVTVADALERLEPSFGSNYRLSLVARCVNPDIEDADIVVTADELESLVACVKRRAAVVEKPPCASPEPIAHLVLKGKVFCGQSHPHNRFLRLTVWLDAILKKDGPFCPACVERYQTQMDENEKPCTMCNGMRSGTPKRGGCPRCAGFGRYPLWAAEELEEG